MPRSTRYSAAQGCWDVVPHEPPDITEEILVTLEGWQEQLRRGGLDLAILLAVARGPRYGLEIIRHLEQFTDLVVTEGTVYPILGRLTAEGLLKAEWNASDAPHPRKYYRLTDRGRKRLEVMTLHWNEFIGKIARLLEAAQGGTNETERSR